MDGFTESEKSESESGSGFVKSNTALEGSWHWPWPWIGARSCQHLQYVQDYQRDQPCDCSLTQYQNMVMWISWNIDIPRSLNLRDSFPRRKFENRALTSCRRSILTANNQFSATCEHGREDRPIECNFRNFESSVTLTLTLDWVEVTLVRTSGRGLLTYQIRSKSEKKTFCGRTDLRTADGHPSSVSLSGHRLIRLVIT